MDTYETPSNMSMFLRYRFLSFTKYFIYCTVLIPSSPISIVDILFFLRSFQWILRSLTSEPPRIPSSPNTNLSLCFSLLSSLSSSLTLSAPSSTSSPRTDSKPRSQGFSLTPSSTTHHSMQSFYMSLDLLIHLPLSNKILISH